MFGNYVVQSKLASKSFIFFKCSICLIHEIRFFAVLLRSLEAITVCQVLRFDSGQGSQMVMMKYSY